MNAAIPRHPTSLATVLEVGERLTEAPADRLADIAFGRELQAQQGLDGFLGSGYGIPTPEEQSAIAATARAEEVFLDPTYTGKAMAGYRKLLSDGLYADAETALFLHTGGTPSLFTAAVEGMS